MVERGDNKVVHGDNKRRVRTFPMTVGGEEKGDREGQRARNARRVERDYTILQQTYKFTYTHITCIL